MERVKVSKTERLLNLISFMLRSRNPVPFSAIAGKVVGYDDDARLDSIEKRFDRDKAELRNMGIPVEYRDLGGPDVSGYVIPRSKFFLGKLELDVGDAILLAVAGREEGFTQSSMLIKDAFESAMRKLSIDVPSVDHSQPESGVVLNKDDVSTKVAETLQTVCSAIYHRRTITFLYQGTRDADPQRRTVNPFGFGLSRGQWYLTGHDHGREATRRFKLSRIQGSVSYTGASDSGPEFEIPAEFRMSDHLSDAAWQFGDQEAIPVKVVLPLDQANQVRLSAGFELELVEGSEGLATICIPARDPKRVLDWLLEFGPDARILSPPDVVEMARERLERMRAGVAVAEAREGTNA